MTGPPRFLLGAALLFWGAMTDRVVPGLAAALLVEGAHWTRVRWNFGERAFLAAWRMSVLFLLMAMVLVLIQGARLNAMARVFTWLPIILAPLQFVQSYGMSRTTSLATFSVLVRRRREHAEKYGLPFRDIRFSFGHVFFCAALLSSCLGEHAGTVIFYPALVALVAWEIIAAVGLGWRGVGVATAFALLASAAGGVAGQRGLSALYRYVTSRGGGGDGENQGARERQTKIGDFDKELNQSPDIQWRLIPEKDPLPRLLRIASYSTYFLATWKSEVILMPEGTDAEKGGFVPLPEIANPANPDDPEDRFNIAPPNLPDPKVTVDPSLSRFLLRGAVPSERPSLLPMPANAASVKQICFEDFERSPFGTFRILPKQPVCDARILWQEGFATELPPWTAMVFPKDRQRFSLPHGPYLQNDEGNDAKIKVPLDLQIPPSELAALRPLVDQLDLRTGSLEEKVARLRSHFARKFRYTGYNSVRKDFEANSDGTMMATFLNRTKAGHCEYFATATALLLREAGVPTRYTTGFAVVEIDEKTGIATLRGTHAHAWVRAWDATKSRWIDVDLTPPSWIRLHSPHESRFQGLSDWFQRHREDLLVWRDQPGHMALLNAAMLTPVLIGLGFVGRNLWRSRGRLDPAKAKSGKAATLAVTPLLSLEKPARRVLGERPPGTPLAPWLMKLAPNLPRPELLAEALKLHHRLRFDPAAHEPELVSELQVLVDGLRRDL